MVSPVKGNKDSTRRRGIVGQKSGKRKGAWLRDYVEDGGGADGVLADEGDGEDGDVARGPDLVEEAQVVRVVVVAEVEDAGAGDVAPDPGQGGAPVGHAARLGRPGTRLAQRPRHATGQVRVGQAQTLQQSFQQRVAPLGVLHQQPVQRWNLHQHTTRSKQTNNNKVAAIAVERVFLVQLPT